MPTTNARLKSVRAGALDRSGAIPTAETRLRSALESMAAGLVVLDEDYRVVLANAAALDLLGLAAAPSDLDALLGDIVYGDAFAPDASFELLKSLPALLDRPTGEALRCERADGRMVSIRSDPMGDGWVLTLGDVTHHREAERRAMLLARQDALTGLPNRVQFHERLCEAVKLAARQGVSVAVLCLDLDRFKTINDTLGHPLGDALLVAAADRLRAAVRDGDLIARMGGDEFAVLQVGLEQPTGAAALAQRLVELIGQGYLVEGHMMNVGASVGVALAHGGGEQPDDILRNADLALHRAKADGGGGAFRFFEPEMDRRMQARRALEIDLRRALAMGEFAVHYQPQMQLSTRRIVGFEALIRWNHPVRGYVPPLDFIPLAEEIGLIIPIGEWVLRTACEEAATWLEPVSIAVNLSAVQFQSANLFGAVASALANAGLDPQRLELEITESALLHDTDATLGVLHRMRALGVRISLDDFGTGYSSLSYLQKFPFDKIKIDQSFVARMTTDTDCAAIVRAVAGLGASLGMKTTAEGVETEEQMERIRQEGCHEVQGYLISRPVPPSEIAAVFARLKPAAG